MSRFLALVLVLFCVQSGVAQQPVHPSPDQVQPYLGWVVDVAHRAATLEPHLPESWTYVTSAVMLGKDRVELTITRDEDVYSVTLHRTTVGPPLSIRISPGLPLAARVDRITINEMDVAVQVEVTEHDIHPSTEMLLFTDAVIEFHYSLH